MVPLDPPVRSKKQVDSIKTLRLTLREYYAEKQTRLQRDLPCFHEQQLRQIFPASVSHKNERAAPHRRVPFLQRVTMELVTGIEPVTPSLRVTCSTS